MNTQENDYLSSLEKMYREKIDHYTKKLEAVKTLKEEDVDDLGSSNDISNSNKFTCPDTYEKNLTQDQKVYFALKNIGGSGFVGDVADALIKLDDNFNEKSAKKLATQKLSKLKGEGYLKYAKKGVKYKYSIK